MFKVLEFWAVWCDPCKRQAPGVAEAREKFGDYMTFERINVDEDVKLQTNMALDLFLH